MENNKSANQILLDAANLLTKEGMWSKGAYFKASKNSPQGCSMCAHGAIAYCGSPEVKEAVLSFKFSASTAAAAATSSAATSSAATAGTAYYSKLAERENLTLPEYILKYYGEVGLAHYKAAKAGLTFGYNDNPFTTEQDVINKLREAATNN